MKRSAVIATGAALALGLSIITAVTVAPSLAVAKKASADRHACFDPDWVRGFQTKDDQTIIIMSSDNKAFELKLGGICSGLDSSVQMGIRSRHGMSQVCGPFDADIIYDDMGSPRACSIVSVRHLEGEEAEPYVRTARSDKNDKREDTRVNSGRDDRDSR